MEDVAAEAGVSRALVSLVMRDSPNVSDQRRAAVLDAASRLGYRPNAAARSLAERRSMIIGVVVDDLHNPYFADVVDGVGEVAAEGGYRLLLSTSRLTDAGEQAGISDLLEYRVEGVVVLGGRGNPDVVVNAARSAPVVTVGFAVEGVDCIVNDDHLGAKMVVDHLVGLGHTNIAHIDGGNGGGADLRRAGFVDGMRHHGLEPRVIDGEYTEQAGVEGAETLLASGDIPSALFVANDISAVGAVGALTEAGWSIPDDVSVVGYDNIPLAGLRNIELTTVNQPRTDMGRRAAAVALERLDNDRRGPVRHVVSPELVVRRTTGPAPLPAVETGAMPAT